MYLTTIAGGSGDTYHDVQGRTLILTGNDRLWSGRQVWTDGHYIFSFAQQSDVPPQKPVISGDKLLPILCNNGSELLVFDKNFALIGKYNCSKNNIISFCNIADYFSMGDINGNIYTSDGKEYNVYKLGYYKNYYVADSIAITKDSIYALASESNNLDEIWSDFSLTKNGKLVYTSYDLWSKLKDNIPLPESKVLEHYGYYYIVGSVLNMGWPKKTRDRIDAIRNDPASAGAFSDENSETEITKFLERSSFMNGRIYLKNKDGDTIGLYNFDKKAFDFGTDLDLLLGCYTSNYDEHMTALAGEADKALEKLNNDDYRYKHIQYVSFSYERAYCHHKAQSYGVNMRARYLYKNGDVLISATGSGDCTTTDSYITGDDIYHLKYDTKSTTDSEINKQYQGIIDKSGNISLTQTDSKVYKLDDTVLVSSGTGFCENTQVTKDGAGNKDWTNFSAIHMGKNVFGFYGGELGQNIYVNGKAVEKLSSREYVNNRLNWISKGTLAKLCKFLGAKAEK